GPGVRTSAVMLRVEHHAARIVFAASFDGVEGIAVSPCPDRDALHTVETRCKDFERAVGSKPQDHIALALVWPLIVPGASVVAIVRMISTVWLKTLGGDVDRPVLGHGGPARLLNV